MKEQYHDFTYLNLVNDVLNNGKRSTNRTGTDTLRVFSREMRFDLSNGSIPLLTTKKMHTRSIIHEILWYLQGTGSGDYLKNNNVRIWNEWMSPENHLNFVYGYQWRRWPVTQDDTPVLIKNRSDVGTNKPYEIPKNDTQDTVHSGDKSDDFIGQWFLNNQGSEFKVIKKMESGKNTRYLVQFKDTTTLTTASRPSIRSGHVRDPYKKTIFSEGCIGIINEKPSYYKKAYDMWYNMMRRCHDVTYLPIYLLYGGDGIFVDQRWRCFRNFLHDIRYLPGFLQWERNPNLYDLDKDYYSGSCYSKDTCLFTQSKYNKQMINTDGSKIVGTRKCDGYVEEFTIAKEFARKHNMNSRSISHALLHSPTSSTQEWHFKKIKAPEGHMYRKRLYIDQIANTIQLLKNNPTDRRIIVNAWNVGQLDEMALPPCHAFFQFFSQDNKLSCKLTQRSCDVGLGVPFNIVQYSILTHMMAQVTNHEPGEFIWSGGDIHIYEDHVEPLREQLTREPYRSPRLELNTSVKDIDGFKYDDFSIVDYTHHPIIKMKVSV